MSDQSDLFYPGFVDDITQIKLRNVPALWRLVSGIASGSGKRLRISRVIESTASSPTGFIYFASPSGFEVLVVRYSPLPTGDEYCVVARTPTQTEWQTVISSKNPKYALSLLLKERSTAKPPRRNRAVSIWNIGKSLENFVDNCERYLSHMANRLVTEASDTLYGRYLKGAKGHVNVPMDVMADICKAVFEDRSVLSVQTNTLSAMKEFYESTSTYRKGMDAYAQFMKETLCRDKWLIGFTPKADGKFPLIVAGINFSNYITVDGKMANSERLFDFDIAPRAYKSTNDIDLQYRASIQAALTFLKVALADTVPYGTRGTDPLDPEALLPFNPFVNEAAGAVCVSNWNGTHRGWLLVDR